MRNCPRKEALPFKEGTWFAVPLQDSGYAVGRVARLSPDGAVILAYFFGPKRKSVPTLGEIEQLQPTDSVAALRASELGLLDGRWPIIGDSESWDRNRWPIPAFVRRDPLSATAWEKQRGRRKNKGDASIFLAHLFSLTGGRHAVSRALGAGPRPRRHARQVARSRRPATHVPARHAVATPGIRCIRCMDCNGSDSLHGYAQ